MIIKPFKPRLLPFAQSKLAGIAGLLMILIMAGVASASSQSFNVLSGQPQNGMLMSLTANSGVIEPANTANSSLLVGVVAPNSSDFSQQSGQVSVQTDGAANALVSTLGGDVRVGDRITASPLQGVGTKTTTNAWIVGVAQGSLDASTSGAVKTSVKDAQGVAHSVYVASIPLLVKVTYYTASSASTASVLPSSIQSLADTIAGKHASLAALVLASLLLIIGVVLAGIITNSAIKDGMAAISRQPLTKTLIQRKVLQALAIAIVIIATALAGGLLLLKIL